MKQENSVLLIILTFVTFGIYGLFWLARLGNEIGSYTQDRNYVGGWKMVIFTVITCGIYGCYWNYQAGKILAEVNANKEDNSIIYFVLNICGLSIVSMVLIQEELNKINAAQAQ